MDSNYTIKLQLDTSGLKKSLAGVQQSLKGLGKISLDTSGAQKGLAGLGASLGSVKNIVMGLGIAKVFQGITSAIKESTASMFEFANNVDQAQRSFEILLGNVDLAKALVNDLKIYSQESTFSFEGASTAARQLLAYGFEINNIMPMMSGIGDAASAMGGDIEQSFGRITRALGQIRTNQQLYREELNQLTEVGIPAAEILGEKLGLTADQLKNIGKQGIDADTAIQALMEGMEERYAGAMEAMASTVPVLLANIKEAVASLGAGIFEPMYESFREMLIFIKAGLTVLQNAFNEFGTGGIIDLFPPEVAQVIRDLIGGVMTLVSAFKYLWDAISPIITTLVYFAAQIASVVIPIISALAVAIGRLINWFRSLVNSFSWVQAAIQKIVNALATLKAMIFSFFGINTSKIFPSVKKETIATTTDYANKVKDVNSAINNVGNSATNSSKKATSAVKKLASATKTALSGLGSFDEVFTLTEKAGSAGGTSGTDGAGGGLDDLTGLGDLEDVTIPTPDTSGVTNEVEKVKVSLDELISKFEGLGEIVTSIFTDFPLTIGGALGAAAGILLSFNPPLVAFAGMFIALYATMDEFRNDINNIFADIGGSLQSLLNDTLIPAGKYLIFDFAIPIASEFETLKNVLADVFIILATALADFTGALVDTANSIWNILQPALELIKTIVIDTIQIINNTWEEYGASIVDGVTKTTGNLRDLWSELLDLLEAVIKPFLEMLVEWWDTSGKGMVEKFTGTVASLVEVALTIYNNVIDPIVKWLIDFLKPIWDTFWDGAATLLGSIIGTMSDVLGALFTAIEGLGNFITGVFSADWDKAWNGIKQIFEGVITIIGELISGIFIVFNNFGLWIADVFVSLWTTAWDNAKGKFEGFKDGISTLVGNIKDFFSGIVTHVKDKVTGTFETAWNGVKDKFDSFKKGIGTLVGNIKDFFSGIVTHVKDKVTGTFETAWNGVKTKYIAFKNSLTDVNTQIKEKFNVVKDFVKGTFKTNFESAWTGVKTKYIAFKNSLTDVNTQIKSKFNEIKDFVKGTFKTNFANAWQGVVNKFGTVFEGIKSKAKAPVNGVISILNSMIDGVNKLKFPDWVPVIGGKGISISRIPKLAGGGMITRNIIAELGESRQREAIIPLQDTTALDAIGQAIAGPVAAALGNTMSGGLAMQSEMLASSSRTGFDQSSYVNRQGTTINAYVASDVALQDLYRRLRLIAEREQQRTLGSMPRLP